MKTLPPFSEEAKALKPGLYEHFRGNHYEVIAVARHSETLEEMVVYRALYGTFDFWVRPLKMFTEEVHNDQGHLVPRFRFMSDQAIL